MLSPPYLLSMAFSGSQMLYTNLLFCGHDCRSKGPMLEQNRTVLNTLAITLCGWCTTWAWSVWNAFEEPQTHRWAPSCPLICPLLPGAALAPEFPSLFQTSVCHNQPDTPSGRNSPSPVEVHCFYSWLLTYDISSVRNHHSAPSFPHLPIYMDSLPALLLGDLHLFQILITFCLDNFRDFPHISHGVFFLLNCYQGHCFENQTWS